MPIADIVSATDPVSGKRHCRLGIRTAALLAAFRWIQEDVQTADVVVVDGVGKLEATGDGHMAALRWARDWPASAPIVVVSARGDMLSALQRNLALPKARVVTANCTDDEWIREISAARRA
jgi:nucleoside-triphosphatase THEP1